jgi:hypothetical protein
MRCRTNSAGTLALISAVVGLCLSSAAGAAAGRWTSPQRLTAGLGAGTPTLGFDGRGAALATWATAAPGAGRRSASRAPTRVAFGPSRTAPDIGEEVIEGLPPAPVIDRSGGVIAIEQRRVRPACGLATIFDLTPRFGRVNGTFARARGGWRIFSHTEPPAVALAGNTRGVAVVAWLQLRRDAHGCVNREDVRVAVRRPGGTFGAPVTLARGASSGMIAASVSSDGQLLVAWRHGPAIETRSRAQRGPWGPTRALKVGVVDSFAATLASTGATYVIWTQTPSHGPVQVGRLVGAAVRSAHATRFSTRILDRGPACALARPSDRGMDELGGQPSTGTDRDRDRQPVRPGPAGHSARTGLRTRRARPEHRGPAGPRADR